MTVFCQLTHLGGFTVSRIEFPLHQKAVEVSGMAGGSLIYTPYNSVVAFKFEQQVARQRTFRAVCHKYLPA